MAKLSDTALVLLNKAATRDDRLAEPPNHLPAAARSAVVRSLIKQGLLIEDAVELNHPVAWRNDETDADLRCSIALRMTDDGFRALNMDPPESESAADDAHTDALTAPDAASVQEGAPVVAKALEAAQDAPVPATRASLRAVPPSIRTAALGVGASKVQMVFHHVLPLAMPGILTGTILSLATSLGETGPLLLIGMEAFVVNYPAGPLSGGVMDPATALPVQVYAWAARSDPAFIERASGAIIVLLAFLLVMNIVAIILRRRFERRW